MKTPSHSTATVQKRYDEATATITVGIRIEAGAFGIKSDFEQPVVLQPTSGCLRLYPTSQALFQGCEGAAHSGIFYATRGRQNACGQVVITRFDGAALPPDCGEGFAQAAAIACLKALGLNERISQIDTQGWEAI